MRVMCTRLPAPVVGMSLESSPWVTLHAEYPFGVGIGLFTR